MPRLPRALLTAALPLTVAACGGGDGSSGGSDLAKQPADKVLGTMAAELAKVRSYHVDGTQTDKDGQSRVTGDVTSDGSLSLRLTVGARQVGAIVVGRDAYLRGNAAFWAQQSGARLAKLLANRWVKVPQEGAASLGSLEQLLPKSLAYCSTHTNGTVSNRGADNVDGQDVVVVTDKGDRAGTSPGEVYVASSGRPLPVRVTQTGPRKAGGRVDPRCGDADSTTRQSDVHLSRFDQPVAIKAPAGALDVAALQAQNQTS